MNTSKFALDTKYYLPDCKKIVSNKVVLNNVKYTLDRYELAKYHLLKLHTNPNKLNVEFFLLWLENYQIKKYLKPTH